MPSPSIVVAYFLSREGCIEERGLTSFRTAGPIFIHASSDPAKMIENVNLVIGPALDHDAFFEELAGAGFAYVLLPRPNTLVDPSLLEMLMHIARQNLAERVYAQSDSGEEILILRHLSKTSEGGSLRLGAEIGLLRNAELPDPQQSLLVGPHAGCLVEPTCSFSVVVVTYQSEATLRSCLSSVLATLPDDGELIVVDNNSSDGTRAIVAEYLARDSRVRSLPQAANLGYSKAANLGILASKGEYIALLNPDTEVFGGWLEGLASRLTPGVGAVGPVSNVVFGAQYVEFFLNASDRPSVEELPDYLRRHRAGESVSTQLLMGFCLLLSRKTLNRHGLLDESTWLGADDLELSWRLTTLGYQLRVASDIFVRHEQSVSFKSLGEDRANVAIRESDDALHKKLIAFYGDAGVPTSQSLWGCDIFADVV